MTTAERNLAFAMLITRELQRQGVQHVCISPGARSAPLAVAAARNRSWQIRVAIDERAAAYLALGIGRASGKPAAVITTSGTAVANCLPAVVEAAQDEVPLIILSADRPAELRDTRANQTIRQANLFSGYTRWSFDLPAPTENLSPQAALSAAATAYRKATEGPAGAVHLNCQFYEPLLPEPEPQTLFEEELQKEEPFTRFAETAKGLPREEAENIGEQLQRATRGLVLLGELSGDEAPAVRPFLKKLGWPVLAEVRSGWLPGPQDPPVLSALDLIFRSSKLPRHLQPELVLHLGGQPVSKQWLNFLDQNRDFPLIHVDEHARRSDPVHRNNLSVNLSPAEFCRSLPLTGGNADRHWKEKWGSVIVEVERLISGRLANFPSGEGGLLREIYRNLPEQSGLFLASSSTIRLAEMFRPGGQRIVPTFANRGASGIDGNLATAIGVAIGGNRPLTAVLGDLALLHDLNTLALVRQAVQPFVLVVLNNFGGEIFSWLPYRLPEEEFEALMATPHHLEFAPMAERFGGRGTQVRTVEEFTAVYRRALKEKGWHLIEFLSEREANARFIKSIYQEAAGALDALF
ncbi:MAG: 2-succinyl-5-enolpyruvyl-6-hydroxy-3-cyclohexene-1-carboxylic-acid synthase [Calditrichia bacterium]